jgi:hypothetical protein
MWGCPAVTDTTVLCLAKHSRKLIKFRSFSATGFLNLLTDYSLSKLWTNCPKLEVMDVEKSQISVCTLITAAENCRYIEITGRLAESTLIKKVHSSRETPDGTSLVAYAPPSTVIHFSFKTIVELCPRLLSLTLQDHLKFTNKMLIEVLRLCPQLCVLKLTNNHLVTGDVLLDAVKCCVNLHTLGVKYCHTLTDDIVVSVLKNGPKWQRLSFESCSTLTEVSVTAVAECCPFLTHFTISGHKTLTDSSICQIIAHCKMLRVLDVSSCILMTTNILSCIHQLEAKKLRKVKVVGCELINQDHIISFLSSWSGTSVVKFEPRNDDFTDY